MIGGTMHKFTDKVIQFELGGVDIIGNIDNGSYCGLSSQGSKIVEKISNGDSLTIVDKLQNKELIKFLEKSGFFSSLMDRKIPSAYLHVTNKCNLKCIGCYSEVNTRNTIDDLSLESIKLTLHKLNKIGTEYLVISGGEPLIRKDLYEILKYAREEVGFKYIVILSNGMLLTEETAMKLSQVVDEYSISMDAFNETCPSYIRGDNIFNQLKEAIVIAKRYFKAVNILPTLHRKNIDNVLDYLELANSLNVNISFSILTCNIDSVTADLIPMRNQLEVLGLKFIPGEQLVLKKNDVNEFSMTACTKCGIGEEIISVAADGKVYPCHMCHVDELSLGNICDEEVENILQNRSELLEGVNVDEIEECNKCRYRYLCGGGCRARAYLNTKSLLKPDPYCVMFKEYARLFEQSITQNFG